MLYRFAYSLVKSYSTLCIYLLFEKVEVFGKENVPEGPVIFAPNHQNAFLDGILTSCLAKKNVSFLARADVFRVKSLKGFLRFFKIIPVYRLRDGASEMSKNYDTFSEVSKHLNLGESIIIFPEGNQQFMRYLRPLKKGIFRILQECENNSEIPKVIPVGINYEHHTKTGYNLSIRFGDPLNFSYPMSNGFVNEKARLEKAISPLIQQIEDSDFQSLSESAWLIDHKFSWKGIEYERDLLEFKEDAGFKQTLNAWIESSSNQNLLPAFSSFRFFDFLKLGLVFLVYLFIVPFRFLVKYIMENITKHESFRLSMTFGFTLFLGPIYVLFLFFVFIQFFPAHYFIAPLLSILFFAKNKRILDRFVFHWRKQKLKRKQSEVYGQINDLGLQLKKVVTSKT